MPNSYPSYNTILKVYSQDNELLASGKVTIGWFINPQVLSDEIRNCLIQIDKSFGNDQKYFQYDKLWKEKMNYIEICGKTIPGRLIRKLCSKMDFDLYDQCIKELQICLCS